MLHAVHICARIKVRARVAQERGAGSNKHNQKKRMKNKPIRIGSIGQEPKKTNGNPHKADCRSGFQKKLDFLFG